MKLKRFLAFAGADYYPCGGWDDLLGSFESREEAVAAIEQPDEDGDLMNNWGQIVDSESGNVIATAGRQFNEKAWTWR